MTIDNLLNKQSQQIVDEIDRTIATIAVSEARLTFAKEIIFKLLPAIAIVSLIVYLTIFDRHFERLPIDPIFTFVYLIGLYVYGIYLNVSFSGTVYKLIYGISIVGGGTYLILTTKEYWVLPDNNYLSFLYIFTLFLVVLADSFYIIDYIYLTPRYADKTLFKNHRDLFTANLAQFSEREIDIAYSSVENISDLLSARIMSNILPCSVLFVLAFCGLISISLFQVLLEANWSYNPFAIAYGIILILLSLALIFLVIKNIRDVRQSDRYVRYDSILTESEIERIGITEFFRRRKPKFIPEIEEQIS